jgi:hypothetical protein
LRLRLYTGLPKASQKSPNSRSNVLCLIRRLTKVNDLEKSGSAIFGSRHSFKTRSSDFKSRWTILLCWKINVPTEMPSKITSSSMTFQLFGL